MRRASQALAELNQQQKAVALGGSSKARYREAQVGAANECTRRLENCKLSEVQDQIAALQEQLQIDQQVQEVCCILDSDSCPLPLTKQSWLLEQRRSCPYIRRHVSCSMRSGASGVLL